MVGKREGISVIDRRRVLIIDKNRRTADELQETFVKSGYEAEVALSALVGESIISERRMDVAVLNADIGHKEDWKLVRKLRKYDPLLPLVLFNAPKVKELSREARRIGVERFIDTPLDPATVLAEATKVVRN